MVGLFLISVLLSGAFFAACDKCASRHPESNHRYYMLYGNAQYSHLDFPLALSSPVIHHDQLPINLSICIEYYNIDKYCKNGMLLCFKRPIPINRPAGLSEDKFAQCGELSEYSAFWMSTSEDPYGIRIETPSSSAQAELTAARDWSSTKAKYCLLIFLGQSKSDVYSSNGDKVASLAHQEDITVQINPQDEGILVEAKSFGTSECGISVELSSSSRICCFFEEAMFLSCKSDGRSNTCRDRIRRPKEGFIKKTTETTTEELPPFHIQRAMKIELEQRFVTEKYFQRALADLTLPRERSSQFLEILMTPHQTKTLNNILLTCEEGETKYTFFTGFYNDASFPKEILYHYKH